MTTSSSISQSTSSRKSDRLKADLGLVLVTVIWGSAFVVQRLAAAETGVNLFNGARFLLGGVVLFPLAFFRRRAAETEPLSRKNLPGIVLAGCLLVGGSSLQQAGLVYTTAGNAGFITGLYVVLVPLFLALFWRRRPQPMTLAAAGLALVGMFLLSTGGNVQQLNRGDLLELVGAVFWALHVIAVGLLVRRLDVLQFAVGQYLVCGAISLGMGLAWEAHTLPGLAQSWWAVAYAGLVSVGLGYTIQAAAQRHAPAADAAIILSGESLFAALSGWIFLNELLQPVQLLGCAVILAGMLLAQVDHLRPGRRTP